MDTRFTYWKIERSQARWNCIVDTPENRQQALNNKAMFFYLGSTFRTLPEQWP